MKDHNRRKVATIPGFQGIGQITPEAINQATKEGKPGPPKAYRPLLYLLNILSNLYETMIRQDFGEMRLRKRADWQKISIDFEKDDQYCRQWKICSWNILVTLDIQNVFNAANCSLILRKLEDRKLSLCSVILSVSTSSGKVKIKSAVHAKKI